MSRSFTVRWWTEDKSLQDLIQQVLKTSGCRSTIKMGDIDDISWAGEYVLLVSDGSTDFREVVQEHPDSRFFVVGSPYRYVAGNATHSGDLMEAYYQLRAVSKAHEDKYDPEVGDSEKRARRARKVARRFSNCVYCGKPISVRGLALKSHEQRCRRESIKKPAKGILLSAFQACGKSKGSILILEIPEDLVMKNFQLGAGCHIISDRKMIRILNAELGEYFNYELEKESEDDTHDLRAD